MEETERAQNVPQANSLFAQVYYHIVQSPDLKDAQVAKLAEDLEANGAVEHTPPSHDGKVPLKGLTHIISPGIDFEGYEVAADNLIPIVKPDWITSSLAKKKLANPRSHSPDPRRFFSGLVITCADLPEGDKDAIIGGVLAMGGLYSSAMTRLVTHVVALSLASEKCRTALAKKIDCKIVLPHWFDDCLRLGRRIHEGPYLHPDPEIFRYRHGDKMPETPRPDLQGALSPHPGQLPPTPEGSPSPDRQRLSLFKSKRVMLLEDLEIAPHLRSTIERLIESGGGAITKSVSECDMFICQYREGEEYRQAARSGKDVGNLPWLYELFTRNRWTSPLRRLLHYPIARKGLPGFSKFRISLSNYNGEARSYLENLAKAAGCEFTKTMKMDNTHLITAHPFSDKCEAAKEWNVHMINHLWLEESYARWEIQTLSNPRYTHFPPRTNLGEVVGQTPIDKAALATHFHASESKGANAAKVLPQEPPDISKLGVTASKPVEDGTKQPAKASEDKADQKPEAPRKAMEPKAKVVRPRITDEPHSSDSGPATRTPISSRFKPDGKENETPSTTGSRGAKDRAREKLQELAPDIALYEKEKKRVGGVIFGGKKGADEKDKRTARKRSVSNDGPDSLADEPESSRAAKRPKKSKGPTMHLLLSGYEAWVNDFKRETEARPRLRDMGIVIVQQASKCTHLAAPRILRTPKFLSAIAHAPILLSTTFIDACLEHDELQDPNDFLLQDADGEARFSIQLPEVLERAKANQGALLRGYSIYCTEHVKGGWETYKQIIEENSGSCCLYRGRPGSVTAARRSAEGEEMSQGPEGGQIFLVSGASKQDAKLWAKFRQSVEGIGRVPMVVKTDWLLDVALSQEARAGEGYLLTEEMIEG